MTEIVGNLIVLTVLGVVVFFAIRAMCKQRKSGGGCSGDCSSCSKCKH